MYARVYADLTAPTEDEIEAELARGRAEALLSLAAVDAARAAHPKPAALDVEPTEAAIEAELARLRAGSVRALAAIDEARAPKLEWV